MKVVLPDPWVALYAKTGAHYADEAVREQLIKVLDFKIERLWEHHAPIVITKTVTETVTVNSVSTTTVMLYWTVTEVKTEYVPVCAQRVRAYLPSEVNDVLKPYFKLKSLYQSVSNGTDYKALILKGAFQKNVFYMSELSSLVDVVLKINQLYGELNASLQTVKELLKEKPSLNVIFRIMDLIQRAKINIALIKSMISQADALERAMVRSRPATSCPGNASEVVYGILNAENVEEVVKWRKEAEKYGGLEVAVKCLIASSIEEISKDYREFRNFLERDLKIKEQELLKLEEVARLLSIS